VQSSLFLNPGDLAYSSAFWLSQLWMSWLRTAKSFYICSCHKAM